MSNSISALVAEQHQTKLLRIHLLAASFDYSSHSADSIRFGLAEEWRLCAGALQPCGKCDRCDPGRELAAAAAWSARASQTEPQRPAMGVSEFDELGGSQHIASEGECKDPKRLGNKDENGSVLLSDQSEPAFVNAHVSSRQS